MLQLLALSLLAAIARARTADAGFEHWKFDQCRAFVGRIEVTPSGVRAQPPKPQPRPGQICALQRSRTGDGMGRSVVFIADGQRHALDQPAPSRQEGYASTWEQYEPALKDWIVYQELGSVTTVTIQRKQDRGAQLDATTTDIVLVTKYSSDGQYAEQAFARNPAGDVVYENGTVCGKSFGEESTITVAPAGPKADALKFGIATY